MTCYGFVSTVGIFVVFWDLVKSKKVGKKPGVNTHFDSNCV